MSLAYALNSAKFWKIVMGMFQLNELKDVTSVELRELRDCIDHELNRREEEDGNKG